MIAYAKMVINGQEEEDVGLVVAKDDTAPLNPQEEAPAEHH